MALTKTQVSQLYVSLFGRASEGEGNTHWQAEADMATAANAMLDTDAANTYFGGELADQAFIEYIYLNTLGKTYAEDSSGVDFWTNALATNSRGTVVAELIKSAVEIQNTAPTAASQQFANRVEVSDYTADTLATPPADYATSTAFASANKPAGALTVTDDAATVTTAKSKIDSVNPDHGETFVLTKSVSDEVVNGTEKNDIFDATELGSLQNGDLVLDNTTTDSDILNASVNSDSISARIQNVETLNIQGEFVKTGFNLTNVSGTKDLNLSTKIAGGVATVTAANSLNAENINAGTNIATLDITSLTSGTRDEVTVDAGAATTINLTGAAAGADNYNVTATDDATVTLTTINSAGDTVTINAAGELELDSAQGAAAGVTTMTQNLELDINASDDLEVTLSQSAAGALIGKEVTLSGNGDITLVSTNGLDLMGSYDTTVGVVQNYDGVKVTASNSGVSTIAIDTLTLNNTVAASVATIDLSKAAVDIISLTGGTAGAAAVNTTGTTTINENTTLNLAADLGGNGLTLNVDNGDKDTAFTTGTAMMTISEAQTSAGSVITTGASVDTLLISAEADEVTDYDADENGFDEISSMVVDDVTLSAAVSTGGATTDTSTDVMVVQGDENITFNNITVMNYGQVISAASLEGDLTINSVTDSDVGATANAAKFVTIVGGKGDDIITTGTNTKLDVQAMYGDNIINVATAAAGTKVTTGAGDDRITSSTTATTIKAGAGNDTVIAAGNDTIWTEAGSDKIEITDNLATVGTVTVKDFVKGTDTVVLTTATAAGNIRLDNLDVAAGVYTVAGTAAGAGVWDVKLENSGTLLSSKDMRDSIQVRNVTLDTTAASVNVLGNKDDSVIVAAGKMATVTLGGGDDSVEIVTAAAATAPHATIKDFTVGEDKVILTSASSTASTKVNVNLKNVSDVLGVYTIGDATIGADIKLENGGSDIVTDNDLESMVQLGKATAAFTVENAATATAATDSSVTVSGGKFDDVVELVFTANTTGKENNVTYNFKNDGGVDTIIMAANVAATGANVDHGSYVDFNQITGIDTITDAANKKVDLAANASKIADAKDSAVYVFADSSDGTGSAEITTFVKHTANGYTQEVIDDEIAAFINAGLGVQDGENYIVVINDQSTATYQAAAGGGQDVGTTDYDAYAYLVKGDADGVQADNITLIGMLDDDNGTAGDTVFTALDIA
ncbi:hypothetical protein M947_11375 [Sulfurimonas hongkongensis]|uniref:DUF4214 domain-containing protein n=1 Tax=Sulfurimonas hongkongensis TaxID=1172190 RepID=T0J8Q2_9BACT|nr:hypothetical protein [Sulfurimonas hongkongensis]EQB34361.1 hypothetical protein M947_11375 [Sulfurimonas hongkongensis]